MVDAGGSKEEQGAGSGKWWEPGPLEAALQEIAFGLSERIATMEDVGDRRAALIVKRRLLQLAGDFRELRTGPHTDDFED